MNRNSISLNFIWERMHYVFEMLPESERKVYASVVGTLKRRFRPIDIEELRGLEFNQDAD